MYCPPILPHQFTTAWEKSLNYLMIEIYLPSFQVRRIISWSVSGWLRGVLHAYAILSGFTIIQNLTLNSSAIYFAFVDLVRIFFQEKAFHVFYDRDMFFLKFQVYCITWTLDNGIKTWLIYEFVRGPSQTDFNRIRTNPWLPILFSLLITTIFILKLGDN